MPREREHISKKIKTVDYDIADNQIRAWYNSADELIFVLDETINADKPNVLLVIDSFDERKWDDVLSNDYGIDLETVRPKKDNKYQKLDIEYGGLDVYSELINAYESDDDLDEPLENLMRFRTMSVRRSAKERLAAAEDTISKTHDTIERTNDAISELRARIKELRSKLSEQKRNVGREPTKVSAAKILKTESQIDATDEKLARAKKRLESAKRRLVAAEDDAEIARAILARHVDIKPSRRVTKPVRVSKPAPVVHEEVWDEEEPADDYAEEEYDDTETYDAKAEEMTDEVEEVKPLFDKDPEVLDDNIAFKPIDFNAVDTMTHDEPVQDHAEPVVAPAPLSFAPPASQYETKEVVEENITSPEPVLDNLTAVEQQPVVENNIEIETTVEPKPIEPEPVAETAPVETIAPVEPITPVRPVSPITGYAASSDDASYTRKPTLIYYLLLILLIVASIFTLWLYQKNNNTVGEPDLAMTKSATENAASESVDINISETTVKTSVTKQEEPQVAKPEIIAEPAAPVIEPEPVAVAVSEPEPIVKSEPVVDVAPVAVAVVEPEPTNVTVESPFIDLRTVANYEPEKKPIPTEEEILARKPGYSVSQNEKMFVASPEYETETVAGSFVDADYSMDTDVQPVPVPEIVASEVTDVVSQDSDVETCADGAMADEYGCCPGEIFRYTQDGYMCCVDDDCFPPLQ